MNTEFLPIPGYEDRYAISQDGRIISLARTFYDSKGRKYTSKEKLMSTRIDHRSGYPVVMLTKEVDKYGTQYIHRLVALTFIPNPLGKPYVNHKDGNRRNYHVDNLEWVSPKENHEHAVEFNLIKYPYVRKKGVKDRCKNKSYSSIIQASRANNISYSNLKLMLNGLVPNKTCLELIDSPV